MFLYFLFASGTFMTTAAGFLYLYDKNKAETLFYNVTWSAISIYTNLEDFFEKRFKLKKTEKKLDEKVEIFVEEKNIKESDKITYYDKENDKYETVIEIPDKEDLEWGFVKKKMNGECKCRIYDNISEKKDEDEFIIIEKPFLQVELEQNEKNMEIQEYLHYFFLKDNKLFDRDFLKWYLRYWYQIDLEENYKLNIIDHEINIINLDPTQYIILGDKGNYSIKK